MEGNTAFISYILVPSGLTAGGSGYTQAIHCNYFKKIDLGTSNPEIQDISFYFTDINDFKFLTSDISNGTGYSVNEIHALVQIVDNSPFNSVDEIKPASNAWKQYNVTSQVTGYISGSSFVLTAADLVSVVYKISLLQYSNAAIFKPYTLDYLNYPSKEVTDDNDLCFGASTFFLGNVTTEIKAIAYTTQLSIDLILGQFNSSSNLTWDRDAEDNSVVITEIGIYDANKKLVGIGKLNNPIKKSDSIARTIIFAIDF